MADVQAENGHIRIAHSLNRAILVARFKYESQRRIVTMLVDLTVGWNRRTVEISVPDLAALLDLTPGGRFRTALADLVEAGVVLQLRAGSGRMRSVFAVQRNHEAWGKYSVVLAFLADRFKRRPHADALYAVSREDDPGGGADDVPLDPADRAGEEVGRSSVEGASTGAPSLISQGASMVASSNESAPLEASTMEHAPIEARRVPPPGYDTRPHGGTLNPPNSNGETTYERLKTGKTEQLTTTTTTARAKDEAGCLNGGTLPPRYHELLSRFGSDAEREAVRVFLDRAGFAEAMRLVPVLLNWLDHEMVPPIYKARITSTTVAAALLEYKGSFDPRHVWAFVTGVVSRFEKEAAATGSDIATVAATELSVARQASHVWRLIKREGLVTSQPDIARQRIDELVAAGEVVDAAELRAFLVAVPRSSLASARTDHYAEKIVAETLVVSPVRMPEAIAL